MVDKRNAASPNTAERLSTGQSQELLACLARLGSADLPLDVGLRVEAEELGESKLASAMIWTAERIRKGEVLEVVLSSPESPLPPHISGLFAVSAGSGNVAATLTELETRQSAMRMLRNRIASSLAYSVLVLCLAVAVGLFLVLYISPDFEAIYREFKLDAPAATQFVFWFRDVGIWCGVGAILLLGVVLMLVRIRWGAASWCRLCAATPLFGAFSHWSGIAEWASLLSVLIRNGVPLPAALRLAAGGVRDANLSELSLELAEGVQSGQPLSQLIGNSRRLPATIVPLIQWGEQTGTLPEAIESCREIFERRVRARAAMLNAVGPPLIFLLVGLGIFQIVSAFYDPVVSAIQGLG